MSGANGGERSSLDLSLLGGDYENSRYVPFTIVPLYRRRSNVVLVEEVLLNNVPFSEWQKDIIMCWLQVPMVAVPIPYQSLTGVGGASRLVHICTKRDHQ